MQTIPDDWKDKSIKWMYGESFRAATRHNHKNSDIKRDQEIAQLERNSQSITRGLGKN